MRSLRGWRGVGDGGEGWRRWSGEEGLGRFCILGLEIEALQFMRWFFEFSLSSMFQGVYLWITSTLSLCVSSSLR